MELANLLASLRRSKLGAILVAFQIALTVAIVSNAVLIAGRYVIEMQRPSGVDEDNVFSFTNQWVGAPRDMLAAEREDLEVIRGTPGVLDAYATNSMPLHGQQIGSEGWPLTRTPSQPGFFELQSSISSMYAVDEHALQTLGLRIVAGRWFTPQDVQIGARPAAGYQIVVTKALADHLLPEGNAAGRVVYLINIPCTIVGVVDTLVSATPWTSFFQLNPQYSVLAGWVRAGRTRLYVVRARPGMLEQTLPDVEKRLRKTNPQRIITELRTFKETRWLAYRDNRAIAWTFAGVCALLLIVTALGIVRLTSYWIAQRRQQIGMRRALGARRSNILAYYQTENLLIAGLGIVVGGFLAGAVNLWLVKSFSIQRLDWSYVAIGAIAVLILGQLAALWPAPRAASIPPAIATRAS
jgi:putative ABC transport system permease protein